MRSLLQEIRAIVLAHPEAVCNVGCIEDAMAQVLFHRSWFADQTTMREEGPTIQDRLVAHPLYTLLMNHIPKDYAIRPNCIRNKFPRALWAFNDNATHAEVLGLIDRALAEVTNDADLSPQTL